MYSITPILKSYLEEDIRTGDITGNLIPKNITAEASIFAREGGMIAGINVIEQLFSLLECRLVTKVHDGDAVDKDQLIGRVSGSCTDILKGERVALNILGRMSGIATLTGRFVKKVTEISPRTRIAATRKTTPGFRIFEKMAVNIGGGDTHRFALDDMVLIKENHIRLAGGIESIMSTVRQRISFSKKIDIEVESISEFKTALEYDPDIILLDNMKPDECKACRQMLQKKQSSGGIKTLLEVSGNIDLDNVADYAVFADIISIGSLTHSYRILDLSMLMEDLK